MKHPVVIYLPPRKPGPARTAWLLLTKFAFWVAPAILAWNMFTFRPAWLDLVAPELVAAVMVLLVGVRASDEETGHGDQHE